MVDRIQESQMGDPKIKLTEEHLKRENKSLNCGSSGANAIKKFTPSLGIPY